MIPAPSTLNWSYALSQVKEREMDTKMTALELAILFHVIYERKSAEFNYVTRVDTRIFDPESSNGKLMIAVCEEILAEDILPKYDALTARIAELEGALKKIIALENEWDAPNDFSNDLKKIAQEVLK